MRFVSSVHAEIISNKEENIPGVLTKSYAVYATDCLDNTDKADGNVLAQPVMDNRRAPECYSQ
jgi:hypothetical protein